MAFAKHGTLTAATVATVTLGADYNSVEVLNRGTSAITFTVDGTTPVIDADDTFVVSAGSALRVEPSGTVTVVKLISASTPAYSVTGIA